MTYKQMQMQNKEEAWIQLHKYKTYLAVLSLPAKELCFPMSVQQLQLMKDLVKATEKWPRLASCLTFLKDSIFNSCLSLLSDFTKYPDIFIFL